MEASATVCDEVFGLLENHFFHLLSCIINPGHKLGKVIKSRNC